MKCNQCKAMMINNVFCHESGCPNQDKKWNEDTQEFMTVYACRECGTEYFYFESLESCCQPINDEDTLYTVIKISAWESPEVSSGLTEQEKNNLIKELKDNQYKVEIMTDSEYEKSQKDILTESLERYNVFTRTWWIYDDVKEYDYKTGKLITVKKKIPGPSDKKYIAFDLTFLQARELCQNWNSSHDAGELSLKAEFESQ